MTATKTEPKSRELTAQAYRDFIRWDYPARCRTCFELLKPGDRIDILHPWKTAGNVHRVCPDAHTELTA